MEMTERLSSERTVGDAAIETSQPRLANGRLEVEHLREKWRE